MRKIVRLDTWVVVLVLASMIALSNDATAQHRDFVGTVKQASKQQLVVENRKGDEMSFARSEATRVSGEKGKWESLQAGDSVSVSWKLADNPLIAYRVVVRPTPK
jgi:hypothetical protein